MTPRSSLFRWVRSTGLDGNPLGTITLIVLIASIALGVKIVVPLVRSARVKTEAVAAPRDSEKAIETFNQSLGHQLTMIDGRSLFSIPPRPDRTSPTTVAKNYGGPALIAYVNGTAWFADGQKISDENPKARTLELVKANPPWSVRVKWEGGEFDVELFKRVPIASLNEPLKASAPSFWSTSTPTRLDGSKPGGAGFNPPAGITQSPGAGMFRGMGPGGPPMPGGQGGPAGPAAGGSPPGQTASDPNQGGNQPQPQPDPIIIPPQPATPGNQPGSEPGHDPAPAPTPAPSPQPANPEPANPPSSPPPSEP